MFQIWDLDVSDILQLFGDSEVSDDLFSVTTECFVNFERGGGVWVRHLEVVLCTCAL